MDKKAGAPQPRPTQLPIPDLAGATPAERLCHRPVHEADFQSRAAYNFCCRRVFGDFAAELLDTADAIEVGAAPQHGLALGEAPAETIDDILPARLIGVEESAFDLRPKPLRVRAGRRRGGKPGIGPPAGEKALDVIARH